MLKPRPLPDPPDMRMRLIDSLQQADKIPKSLLAAYRKECEEMANQLLMGRGCLCVEFGFIKSI